MPQISNDSEKAWPHSELNPLLNPVLAKHMGRWAEVYFTNPPEKREQAIADLLRELKDRPMQSVAGSSTLTGLGSALEEGPREESGQPLSWRSLAAAETAHICTSCGKNNPAAQRFCGACGAPLGPSAENADAWRVGPAAVTARSDGSEVAVSSREIQGQGAVEPACPPAPTDHSLSDLYLANRFPDPDPDPHPAGRYETPYGPTDFNSFRSVIKAPDFSLEAESSPRRYRAYLSVTLTVVLAVVSYIFWRNQQSPSGVAVFQSQPAPAEPMLQSAPIVAANPRATGNAVPAEDQQHAPKPQPSENSREAQGSRSPAPAASPGNSAPLQTAAGQNEFQDESEDFITAEKYLQGKPGQARDGQEAAKWLWKAVGKQNLAAALLLSDLYLRGDGVAKSCDQARVLLDAAARKGSAAAAERLRNLPAFGCQ